MTATDGVDRSFLKWLMKSESVTSRMRVLATGTTGSHARIHPRQVAVLDVSVPMVDEQRAVAQVIDDCDAELSALRLRSIKARAVKTGMMQQLLSGRFRLPIEVVS